MILLQSLTLECVLLWKGNFLPGIMMVQKRCSCRECVAGYLTQTCLGLRQRQQTLTTTARVAKLSVLRHEQQAILTWVRGDKTAALPSSPGPFSSWYSTNFCAAQTSGSSVNILHITQAVPLSHSRIFSLYLYLTYRDKFTGEEEIGRETVKHQIICFNTCEALILQVGTRDLNLGLCTLWCHALTRCLPPGLHRTHVSPY